MESQQDRTTRPAIGCPNFCPAAVSRPVADPGVRYPPRVPQNGAATPLNHQITRTADNGARGCVPLALHI